MFSSFIKFAFVLPLIYLIMIGDHFGNYLNPWNVTELIPNFVYQYDGHTGEEHWTYYLYIIYSYLTFYNLVFYVFTYLSTAIFMYKYVKYFYNVLREGRTKQKLKFEEMKLEAKIISEKIRVREAELSVQMGRLQRALDQLNEVRTCVRKVISEDEELRRTYGNTAKNQDTDMRKAPEQEKNILDLMNWLKHDYKTLSEVQNDNMDCGERVPAKPSSADASVYSSVNESHKGYQVKIVKVTNVYKVSYLKHFIKQKKLKRASKQAQLNKKMEDIKKLLEDWQKTLNMAINSKVPSYNVDLNHVERTPQEAMGDISKLRDSSESDSELSWNQNFYRKSMYCFQDPPEMSREYYDTGEYMDMQPSSTPCEWNRERLQNNLFTVAEETSSQMAIQEARSEDGDDAVDWDDINST